VSSLTDDEVRAARLRSGGLAGPRRSSVPDIVGRAVGVQAQEWPAATLAVRARGTRRLTASSVDRARVEDRSVVRGWFMRGTLQLVTAADVPWLVAALGPPLIAGSARRLASVGVTAAHVRRVVAAVSDGPLDRAALGTMSGLTSRQVYHAVRQASLAGDLCYGPGPETWVGVREWLGPQPTVPAEEALAILARRYLHGYGPASEHDLATWSGLPVPVVRRALAAAGASSPVSSRPLPPSVRLVPAYDPYLLGYRDRALSVPAAHARDVHPGGGLLRPTVLRDGVAVGLWRISGGTVTVSPFDSEAPWMPAAEDEARDVERFLAG
jgi:hypothetical protein